MKQEVTPIDGFHYSTDEQFTGKYWIDGKKIYQKSVAVTIPTTSSSGVLVSANYDIGLTNIDSAWIPEGFFSDGNNSCCLPMFITNTNNITKALISMHTFQLTIYSNNMAANGKTAYITVEYTKN